jgi:hypothetical protein
MYQREAMWLAFDGAFWKPNAVKVGVGGINALTGEPWDSALNDDPQDYLVCPDQPWLDGIKTGPDVIRQFVAMPLGEGYTVEGQLTGEERFGGIQVVVFEPKEGLFPDEPPPAKKSLGGGMEMAYAMATPMQAMGLGAGGQITQKIYPDEHGIQTWDMERYGELYVHIVNSQQYKQITGQAPPPTPVNAETYTRYGFPWFALLDETQGDLPATQKLIGVKSIKDKDLEQGKTPEEEDAPLEIHPSQIKEIKQEDKDER